MDNRDHMVPIALSSGHYTLPSLVCSILQHCVPRSNPALDPSNILRAHRAHALAYFGSTCHPMCFKQMRVIMINTLWHIWLTFVHVCVVGLWVETLLCIAMNTLECFQHTSISVINSPFQSSLVTVLQFSVTVGLKTISQTWSYGKSGLLLSPWVSCITDNGGSLFYDFSTDETDPPAATCCGWLSSGRPVCKLFGW